MRDPWQLRLRRSFDPLQLDDGTVDRVLDGLNAADVPPAYSAVARTLAVATGSGIPGELASETAVAAAFAARVAQSSDQARPSRRPELSRFAGPKLATAAVAGALVLSGSLAAAATGSLPGAAQSIASQALSRVGIHVPGSNSNAEGHRDHRGRSGTGAIGATAGSTSAGQGSPIAGIAQTTPSGAQHGTVVCSAASGGQCQAGQNEAGTGAAAPVPTPNHGGTGTANTASKGASSAGTSTANAASGGASSAGTGNATSRGGSSTATTASGGSSAGASNTNPPAGSSTANGASGGASSAGSGNVVTHPGISAANTSPGGPRSSGSVNAAHGVP
jgi:hypothetical protein